MLRGRGQAYSLPPMTKIRLDGYEDGDFLHISLFRLLLTYMPTKSGFAPRLGIDRP